MGIQKKFLFLCVVCSAALMFCACSKRSVGSGIVQNRMGSGASVKTEQIVPLFRKSQAAGSVSTGLIRGRGF